MGFSKAKRRVRREGVEDAEIKNKILNEVKRISLPYFKEEITLQNKPGQPK